MSTDLKISESKKGDWDAIEALYPEAFPDEDLLPLVRDLLRDAAITTSLIGTVNAVVVGHAIFTRCGVAGGNARVALLGPLAVAPAWQRQGAGTAIVRAGLRLMESAGVSRVFVLGSPAYYGRLGFVQESLVEPPYVLPAEWSSAWQSQSLGKLGVSCTGQLTVPWQWDQPALWAPP